MSMTFSDIKFLIFLDLKKHKDYVRHSRETPLPTLLNGLMFRSQVFYPVNELLNYIILSGKKHGTLIMVVIIMMTICVIFDKQP